MAEVVGLVASIVQIAGAGTKLSSALYNYTTSAVRAEHDITDIASDVKLTSSALERVGKVFETENQFTKSVASEKAIQDANAIIKRCEGVFKDVSELIDKRRTNPRTGKKTLGMMGKLSWPMKEQRVELYRRKLESLKSSLLMLLAVLQLAQGQARGQLERADLEQEREKIRELHQRQQDSLKCLEALETRLNKATLDDGDTLQDSTAPSRVPTLELMFGAQTTQLPAADKSKTHIAANLSGTDDSEISESDALSGDDDEHLSVEELAKAAKNVQKLLNRITMLQKTYDSNPKSKVYKKRRVHKIYQRFCRRWESDISIVTIDEPDEARGKVPVTVGKDSSIKSETWRIFSDLGSGLSTFTPIPGCEEDRTVYPNEMLLDHGRYFLGPEIAQEIQHDTVAQDFARPMLSKPLKQRPFSLPETQEQDMPTEQSFNHKPTNQLPRQTPNTLSPRAETPHETQQGQQILVASSTRLLPPDLLVVDNAPMSFAYTEWKHEAPTAVQDYQARLLLFEQQNKKRLLMARQEEGAASTELPTPLQTTNPMLVKRVQSNLGGHKTDSDSPMNVPLPIQKSLKPNRMPARVACIPCRLRLLKCDGGQICSRCTTQKLDCTYIKSRRGRKGKRKTVEASKVTRDSEGEIESARPRVLTQLINGSNSGDSSWPHGMSPSQAAAMATAAAAGPAGYQEQESANLRYLSQYPRAEPSTTQSEPPTTAIVREETPASTIVRDRDSALAVVEYEGACRYQGGVVRASDKTTVREENKQVRFAVGRSEDRATERAEDLVNQKERESSTQEPSKQADITGSSAIPATPLRHKTLDPAQSLSRSTSSPPYRSAKRWAMQKSSPVLERTKSLSKSVFPDPQSDLTIVDLKRYETSRINAEFAASVVVAAQTIQRAWRKRTAARKPGLSVLETWTVAAQKIQRAWRESTRAQREVNRKSIGVGFWPQADIGPSGHPEDSEGSTDLCGYCSGHDEGLPQPPSSLDTCERPLPPPRVVTSDMIVGDVRGRNNSARSTLGTPSMKKRRNIDSGMVQRKRWRSRSESMSDDERGGKKQRNSPEQVVLNFDMEDVEEEAGERDIVDILLEQWTTVSVPVC